MAVLSFVAAESDPNLADDASIKFIESKVDMDLISQIDIVFASIRGAVQGLKRGFYKQYTLEISPQCFGEESEIMGYRIAQLIKNEEWVKLYEVPGFVYDILIMAVDKCGLEENMYDLMAFCSNHDCSFEKLAKNELGQIFIVTGFINSIAAAIWVNTDSVTSAQLHNLYFNVYGEFGVNLGKLLRFTFNFSLDDIHY